MHAGFLESPGPITAECKRPNTNSSSSLSKLSTTVINNSFQCLQLATINSGPYDLMGTSAEESVAK